MTTIERALRSMCPYFALSGEERRGSGEARGWFRDGMDFPEPRPPFA